MKAKILTFVRGLMNGTPPRFQSYLKSLTLLLVMLMSVNLMAADYEELFTITSGDVVNNSGYQAYTGTKDSRGWVITFGGNNESVGTNSNKRSSCKLSSYSKYAVSPVTTSDVASAFVSTTSVSDVSKISYTFDGGSNQTSTNVYLIYSSDGNTFSQVSLTSGTQGAAISSGTAYEFAKCSGYFGLLFKATNSSGAWRIDDVSITFHKAKASATPYTVTFNAGTYGTCGTSSLTEASAGAGVILPNVTANDGWKFLGWATTSGATTPGANMTVGQTYKPSANITLHAVYKQLFKVTLVRNNSSETTGWQEDSYTLPTDEAAACDGWDFKGWTTESSVDGTTAPDFVTAATATGTYYAVYGQTVDGGSKTYTFTINKDDFPKSGYDANDGEHTSTAKASDNSTQSVKWTSKQVCAQSGKVQIKSNSNNGITNSTLTGVSSIALSNDASNVTTSKTSGFSIKSNGNTATFTSATITYTVAATTTTYKTNPPCSAVTPFTITLKRFGQADEVRADITQAFTLPTTGETGPCNDWRFIGWTANSTYTDGATSPVLVTNSGTETATYYAVYMQDALVDGDQVVIYNPDKNVALGTTTNGSKLNGIAPTISQDKSQISALGNNTAVLTVGYSGSDMYFVNGSKYLTCPASGSGMSFVSSIDNYSYWSYDPNTRYIKNKNAAYNSNPQYFEYYSGFTTYSLGGGGNAFIFDFYKKEGSVYNKVNDWSKIYSIKPKCKTQTVVTPDNTKSITVGGTTLDVASLFTITSGYDGTATYAIKSGSDCAGLNGTTLTATKEGSVVITCTAPETDNYKPASADATVTVNCGNIITITKGNNPTGGTFTINGQSTNLTDVCADGGYTVTVAATPSPHYTLTSVTSESGTVGAISGNSCIITDITANTTINVVFEEDTKYELKWMVSGEQMGETQSLFEGDDVTAPTNEVAVPAACANEGKVFVGWTAQKDYEHATDAPTFFAPHKMGAANETYYAVFATEGQGGTPTTEELTNNNVKAITSQKLAYTTEKTFSGSTLNYSIYGFADVENRPWIQLKKDQSVYIKITAPEDIKQVELTITSTTNSSGGVTDITKHTAYSGSVGLVTTDCTFSTDSKNVGITSTITNNKATIATTASTKEVMIKVTTGARIWGIKTTYGAGTTYSDYVTSCVVPTYSVTIQSNNTTMGSVIVDPEITEDAYEAGTEFYVEATAEEGYRFINWTISDNNEGASLTYAVTETENIFTTGAANVTLTANFEAIPADPITVTLEVGEHGTLDCADCEGNQLTEGTAGEGVLVPNVTANEGWAFLGWSTSSTATEAEYEYAAIFYPSDDNKTLYAVYAQLYKVTLKYTDEVLWQETVGGSVTLPSRNCKNATYKDHFAGWSITEFAEETTNPTETPTIYKGSITPTDDIILYPVFSVTAETTQWKKVAASAISETGVYALLGDDDYPFSGKISSGKGQKTDNAFEFVNGIATSAPQGTCELTMTVNSGKWSMYNADKGYLYPTDNTSGHLAWSTDATVYDQWTYYSTQTTWEYKISSNTYAHLRCYNGQFNTYNSNGYGTLISFAKKETTSVGKYWSKPANDVVNPELDLAAGDYLAPQTIKITAATYQSDYAYRYTTDGSAPSKSSTVYDHNTGIQLEIANNYTVKVIGYDEDGFSSQIVSAEYTIWATYSTLAEMYAGFQNGKPVGLTLTDAYIHKVYTPGGGTTKQLFVQEKNSTLGVVLSGNTSDFGEDFNSGIEGKTISFTVTGEYALGNERQQIGKVKFTNYTINDVVTRPTAEEYATATIAANLIGLTKLDNVYAIAKDGNVVTVNTQSDGLGDSYKVYNIFNVVKTIPESTIACNVKGLFNVRDGQQYIMPVLDTDFDVVEKQDAQLPTVNPVGGASEGEALPVANEEPITVTPAAGFTTSYRMNGAEWIPITTQYVQPTIVEENTTLEVKATRPYYNDASATYFYHIDAGLTKYPITLPSPQTYVKTETDLASAKEGDKVTITISQIVARYWETNVTVVKTDEESVTTDVTPEGNHKYSFIMPAYPVTVKVNYADAPKVDINYNKGDHTGIEGDMPQEHAYIGDEYTLKDCAFHAAGLTFAGWKAYKTGDKNTPVTITDNKIIVPDYNVSVEAQWDEAAWRKEGTWELVTKTSELVAGAYYIMAENVAGNVASYEFSGNSGKQYMQKLTVSNWTDKTVLAKSQIPEKTAILMLSGTTGNWIFTCDNNQKQMTIANTDDAGLSWTDAGTPLNIVKKENGENNEMNINVMHNTTEFHMLVNSQGGYKPYSSSAMAWPQLYRFYPKAWQVTFDDNVEDEEIAVPEMQRADPTTNKVTISTMVPQRTGYEFNIWNSAKVGTGELTANPGDEITLSANKTLYAQWNINQYNVAVAEVENVTIQAKPHSEDVIAEGANADVNFKKSVVLSYSELNEDYVFKSWKVTKADDETTVVPVSVGSSTTFEVPAYAVTVSAVIESKATTQLTVTYHANGGVNKTPEGQTEVSEQVNWNTTIKFSEHPCPFEKNLCTFIGWNTKADGTGTTYKTQVTVKTDIDLYAMWQASAVEYVLDAKEATKVKVQEGVAPAGSVATFVTTYTGTFGQLTDTHKGTLTLTGYAGKVITGVKMQMKSNASSGAGTIVIKVGDKEICSTSYAESFGSHSNSYSVAELQNFNAAIIGETENITIVVSCTDNSLYINGYTIEYEDAEAAVIRSGLTEGQYTTYCEPQKVLAGTYEGATFWNIADKTYMNGDQRLYSITIEQHLGDLEAGVPYIMLPEATQLTGVKYGEAIANPVEEGNNGLYGTFVNYAFDENETEARDAQQLYVISNGTLYLCGTGCGVYANRAYIKSNMINYVAPTGAPRRTIGRPNDTPTTLNGLFGNQAGKAQKALIDGHIYIIRDNKMYNAQGLFVK